MIGLFDPMYWILVGPTMAVAAWASMRVKSTFQRFAQVPISSGMTGAEAAAAVARAGGADVNIEQVGGFLSDHYDPRSKTLRLSPDVYNGRTVSAVAVAAHEAGHAIQDVVNYPALTFRSAMVPIQAIGSQLWVWMLMGGVILQIQALILAGVIAFGTIVLFQLVTLPVEFDASSRAKAVLAQSGIVRSQEEAQGVSKVLNAAAMTYVAGALTAVATLIYYLMLLNSNRD